MGTLESQKPQHDKYKKYEKPYREKPQFAMGALKSQKSY